MSYPHLPTTPRERKPRIRLHPFNRDIWICGRVGDRSDISGVGYSPIEAWQKWKNWQNKSCLK